MQTSRVSTRIQLPERTLSLVALGALMLLGLALRLYNLSPIAWLPDHYDRLIEVEWILEGNLPQSALYSPGFALVLVFPAIVLGTSIEMIQAVTIASGLLLVPLVYLLVMQTSQNRIAAIIASGLCGISPLFVLSNRWGVMDSVVTTLVVLSFLLIPKLKREAVLIGVLYGSLLAVLLLMRQTNIVLVPVVVMYWVLHRYGSLRPSALLDTVTSKVWRAAGLTYVLICGGSIVTGNWFGVGYGGIFSFEYVPLNMAAFLLFLSGFTAAPFLLPFIIHGGGVLWRNQREFLLAAVGFVFLWSFAHAPVPYTNARYVDAASVFCFVLAAYGIADFVTSKALVQSRAARLVGHWERISLVLLPAVLLFAAVQVGSTWENQVKEADNGLAAEVRPVLSELPPNSLLISGASRAFYADELGVEFLDLFDQSVTHTDRGAGTTALVESVNSALDEGRSVYYLYTHMEYDNYHIGGIYDGHDLYYAGISERFVLETVFETEARRGGKGPWRLESIRQR